MRKDVAADAVAAPSPDGGTLRIMAYAFRNEQFAKGVTPFRIAVKFPEGWAGCEIAVTRTQVDDDANWFDEWRAERTKRKIDDDRFGWSPDDPAPMKEGTGLKSQTDRELSQKEIEPKLRACARLGSRTARMRAPGGKLFIDCVLPDNAVLFIELGSFGR